MRKIKKYLLILSFFLLFSTFSVNASIWSDITDEDAGGLESIGLEVFGDATPDNNISQIVAKVIKFFLSLLGTIFIVLVIYGGFIYMTAMGESDKITDAKAIIINASVGLFIVMASYAITHFVIQATTKATGTT